jgi:hypothetical protein
MGQGTVKQTTRKYRLHAFQVVSTSRRNIVTCTSDQRQGFGSVRRFIGSPLVVTTINYNTFKITVIVTHK